MDSFRSYMLRKAYENVKKNGDRLAEAEKQVEWEAFRPIIKPMYTNDTPRGGRPNTDEVVMVKLLVLQAWYGLSDPELQRQLDAKGLRVRKGVAQDALAMNLDDVLRAGADPVTSVSPWWGGQVPTPRRRIRYAVDGLTEPDPYPGWLTRRVGWRGAECTGLHAGKLRVHGGPPCCRRRRMRPQVTV